MNDSLIGFEDSSLIQQWMLTISFLGLALFCLLRLRSGAYAALGAVGGLAGGVSSGVYAVALVENRDGSASDVLTWLVNHPTWFDLVSWGVPLGVLLVVASTLVDRASV